MAYRINIPSLSSENDLRIASITGGGTTEIIDDLNALTVVVNNIGDTVDNLGNRMSTAETDIDSLETRMGTAEIDIEALKTRMSNVEGILYFSPE